MADRGTIKNKKGFWGQRKKQNLMGTHKKNTAKTNKHQNPQKKHRRGWRKERGMRGSDCVRFGGRGKEKIEVIHQMEEE